MNSPVHHSLVLQLLLTPRAPGKQFSPSTGVVSQRDVEYKHPQCSFWQHQCFWLQIHQQDLSLHLAAGHTPTLKCSSMILGYPQNNNLISRPWVSFLLGKTAVCTLQPHPAAITPPHPCRDCSILILHHHLPAWQTPWSCTSWLLVSLQVWGHVCVAQGLDSVGFVGLYFP